MFNPTFTVEFAKAAPLPPHRYMSGTVVKEISLVDDPAILDADESKLGIGVPVVKLYRDPMADAVVAAPIRKGVSAAPGEEIYTAVSRLRLACEAAVVAFTGKQQYLSCIRMFETYVLMGDYCGDMFADNGDYVLYRCDYTQAADGGAFAVTAVTPCTFKLVPVADTPTEKNAPAPAAPQPSQESQMKPIVGVEIPGLVKFNDKGEAEFDTAKYAVDDAGILRPVAAPVTPAPVQTNRVAVAEIIDRLSQKSGQSFTATIKADGSVEVSTAPVAPPAPPVAPPPQAVTKSAEELAAENEKLKQDLAAAKQHNAGSGNERSGTTFDEAARKNNAPQAKQPVNRQNLGLFTAHMTDKVIEATKTGRL